MITRSQAQCITPAVGGGTAKIVGEDGRDAAKVVGEDGAAKIWGDGSAEMDCIDQEMARCNLPPAENVEKAMQPREKKTSEEQRVVDIDLTDNHLFVPTYAQDIYEYLRSKEASTSARPLYMEGQEHINENMRMILVDWLVEIHNKFKFVPETLYLCVNIVDRFLSKSQVTRPRLQLVGITAMFVASKYEEIWPVELRDCVYVCDKAYSKLEILDMEEDILRVLDYRISVPSAHAFLVRYMIAGEADDKIVHLSCFLLDGTLQSYYLLHFLPSQLAAASVFVARKIVGRDPWTPTLEKYTQYRQEEILPVARAITAIKTHCSAGLHAVNKKYAHKQVSEMTLPTEF